jgi:hypothetical protein
VYFSPTPVDPCRISTGTLCLQPAQQESSATSAVTGEGVPPEAVLSLEEHALAPGKRPYDLRHAGIFRIPAQVCAEQGT